MPLTTTTAANTIKQAYEGGFEVGVFRNNSLLKWFPPPFPAVGDTAYRWKINTAGNDSVEVYTEGQAQKDPGNQTFGNAAVSWTYVRGMLQFSGHALDALKSNWINQADEEANLLMDDLIDLITTSFMGGTYGIELSVDYGSAYAGITRNGSASYFEATETAVSRKLAFQDLIDLQETMRDNDKGSRFGPGNGLILCPLNQETNIYQLTGQPAVKNIGPSDAAQNLTAQTFNGVPIVGLPDWTDSVIAFLDMRPEKWKYPVIRPFSVKEMAPSGDSDVYQVSWGGSLVNKMPKFDGKLTSVTA